MAYDIVGFLPLELLVNIVEYLEVGRHCPEPDETIVRVALRNTLAFLGLDEEGVSVDAAIADAISYFRWHHGLQHAQPVRKISLPWSADMSSLPKRPIQCHSRRLCYTLRGNEEAVEIMDLGTGETTTFAGHMGAYDHLVLSDRYLIVVDWHSDNYLLTAWNLHTKQKISQRLERIPLIAVKIVEDKAVIAPEPPDYWEYPYSATFYVWDLSSNRVQSIFRQGPWRLWLFHLAVAENVLVTFEISWHKYPPEVLQTKWATATGEVIENRVFHLSLPLPVGCHPPVRPSHISGCDPCRTVGHKTVAYLFFDKSNPVSPVLLHLEYDYIVDQLTVRRWITSQSVSKETLSHNFAHLTQNLLYLFDSETPQLVVYNANAATTTSAVTGHPVRARGNRLIRARKTSSKATLQQTMAGHAYSSHYLTYLHVFGDRKVFGWANTSGVQLWFFNPKFAPNPRKDWSEEWS